MAQLVVRNLESAVKAGLQRRAKRNRRSMEAEVRDILRAAAQREDHTPVRGLGTEFASLFPKSGPDFVIKELRGYTVEPPTFEE